LLSFLIIFLVDLLIVLVLTSSLLLVGLSAGLFVLDAWGDQVTTFPIKGIENIEVESLCSKVREISGNTLEHYSWLIVELFSVDIILELEVNKIEVSSQSLVQ